MNSAWLVAGSGLRRPHRLSGDALTHLTVVAAPHEMLFDTWRDEPRMKGYPYMNGTKEVTMPGYVSSAEMAMMNSVLDEVCLTRGYGPGPDRNLVAAQIMDLFRNGVTERSELIHALRVRDMAQRSYEPTTALKATADHSAPALG